MRHINPPNTNISQAQHSIEFNSIQTCTKVASNARRNKTGVITPKISCNLLFDNNITILLLGFFFVKQLAIIANKNHKKENRANKIMRPTDSSFP
jgi:hypothetical protein